MREAQSQPAIVIAGHTANFDARGKLNPWTSWNAALDLEMNFYQSCPEDHGYPRFVLATFLDADWTPMPQRTDTIPATQNGMGILSYLKYHELRGKQDLRYLETARAMGDYLVRESLTPRLGIYPAFTRSTGTREKFPLPDDCGSQADRPYEIEPDKGGVTGHALLKLFATAGGRAYLAQSLQNARVLAANQNDGNALHSPWPFRVDYRNGEGRGPVSGNMTYVLRLYDELLALGYEEFAAPRRSLWNWITRFQIPSAAGDGSLFAQFFEDHDTPTNRTAWAPLNLARYLLEKRELLSHDWLPACATLIEFVRANFTHVEFGITVCHEQDEDKQAWGGINSTYGAVLALYAKANGSTVLAGEARAALDFTLYSIDEQGRPRDLFNNPAPGGWQEDAHTDVIHNYADAIGAFPEWGEAR
ncbi:MAG: hypothetical protein ABJC66_00730 [Gammaproteobacteria bacterium]